MLKRLLVLALISAPALAEEAPILAEYWTNNGSLPPEYAWETEVTIRSDGALRLKRCTGYETEGPACKTRRAKVAPEALEAIRAAAISSGLGATPARPPEAVTVGGGMTGGRVWLDGARIDLPSETLPGDAARVATVLRSIADAIPGRLNRFLDE